MKRTFVVFIIMALVGCKEISFQQPQPKGKKTLSRIPDGLHGKYLLSDPDSPAKDTLFVTADGYRIGHNPNEKSTLSDSVVLKHYKGYYFLNINNHPEWLLRVIRPEKNGDLMYLALEQENHDFLALLRRISSDIKIDSVESKGEMLYQIDPTPKQLIMFIDKGYFKKTLLKKMQ